MMISPALFIMTYNPQTAGFWNESCYICIQFYKCKAILSSQITQDDNHEVHAVGVATMK